MKPDIKPLYKQHLAYQALQDKIIRFVVFGGGAGGGKTWLGCEWLLTNCYFYPQSKWFIGRNELTRLMASSYITFLKVCQHHKIPKNDWTLNGKYNYIQFNNGSRIDLLDVAPKPSDPLFERFGSLEFTGGWLEEAGEIAFLAFDVLKTRIGRHLNNEFNLFPSKMLITCNPKKGWLYRDVYKPHKLGELPQEYAFIQSLYQDNPYTAKEYGKNLAGIKDLATKQRLMYGNWEYDDDPGALIRFENIIDLFTNSVKKEEHKYLTCDVARFGQDTTVMYLWQGMKIFKIIVYKKQGLDKTAQAIRDLAFEEKIPYSHIIVDEDGVGGGVVDILSGIKGFVGNSTPLLNPETQEKENYRNLRTQCYYILADQINRHRIAIETQDSKFKEMLTEELEQVKAKDLDKDSKLLLVPKDEVKELIGRSPDYSDCLMMRMWFLLKMTGEDGAILIPDASTDAIAAPTIRDGFVNEAEMMWEKEPTDWRLI